MAVFIPSFGDGGVERMLVNLSRGLVQRGVNVDFITSIAEGPYLSTLPATVRVVEFGATNVLKTRRLLVGYLQRQQPEVLLSAKERANKVAIGAKRAAGSATRVALRAGTTVSQRIKGRNFIKKWRSVRILRKLYPRADVVIAVSQGVARDLAALTGMPLHCIRVVANPVVTPELLAMAQEPVDHPWFGGGNPPVILGAGGLRRQKDFPTLLRAFAYVRQRAPVRLVVLGEGRQRSRLLALAEQLGIQNDFSLPGFVTNPYAYMRKANLFVLSSRWEGSPNVVTEALAVGTPVVAMDCHSGPKEILQGGRYGQLVPVGDAKGLAEAMLQTLDNPLDSGLLQSAAQPYTLEASTDQYMAVLGLQAKNNG